MADIATVMQQERDRLTAALVDVDTRMAALRDEQMGYERELKAIDAYERAKAGKPQATPSGRSPRGARSDTLIAMIAGSAKGMTRAQILEEVGAKGNKAQEGSISNALSILKKKGRVTLKDGVYKAA